MLRAILLLGGSGILRVVLFPGGICVPEGSTTTCYIGELQLF